MTRLAVDTSALVALILGESQADTIQDVLVTAQERLISVGAVVELGIVLASRTGGRVGVEEAIQTARLTVCAMEAEDARTAVAAWQRFGKGNHPARLNYGDCFSYALAKRHGLPLVAVGEDFSRTDLSVVP